MMRIQYPPPPPGIESLTQYEPASFTTSTSTASSVQMDFRLLAELYVENGSNEKERRKRIHCALFFGRATHTSFLVMYEQGLYCPTTLPYRFIAP